MESDAVGEQVSSDGMEPVSARLSVAVVFVLEVDELHEGGVIVLSLQVVGRAHAALVLSLWHPTAAAIRSRTGRSMAAQKAHFFEELAGQ